MIKVNLLRNRGGAGRTNAGATEVTQMDYDPDFSFGDEKKGGGKDTVIKVLVLFLGTASLMIYEWQNIESLDAKIKTANAQVAELDAQISNMQAEVEKAKVLQQQNDEINKKIKIVRDLGKVRLREIRTIDFLQNIVPENVWFVRLQFGSNKLFVNGFAIQEQGVQNLMERMRGFGGFEDVLLSNQSDFKNERIGNLKNFTVEVFLTGSEG